MNTTSEGAQSATSPLWVKESLRAYPHLGPEQLARLTGWFRKEATAMDVGLIASDPLLAGPYRRFRADHIDRFGSWDYIIAGLVVAMIAVVVLVVAAISH